VDREPVRGLIPQGDYCATVVSRVDTSAWSFTRCGPLPHISTPTD